MRATTALLWQNLHTAATAHCMYLTARPPFHEADAAQLKQMGLHRVLLEEESPRPTIWLVTQKGRYLSSAAQEFIRFTKALFDPLQSATIF